MPTIRIDIDSETHTRLTASAEGEHRPVAMQAKVLLMRALGTFPALGETPEEKRLQSGVGGDI